MLYRKFSSGFPPFLDLLKKAKLNVGPAPVSKGYTPRKAEKMVIGLYSVFKMWSGLCSGNTSRIL